MTEPTTTPPTTIATEWTERIYSPLHRLRGTIRRYILWDTLVLTVIALATWFWVGLLLDYGVFKLTGWDWVQILPWSVRLVVLAAISAVIVFVVAMSLRSLLRRFRPESLALVLERRFPRLLRDQLITAVELTDLDRAESYGYSRQMIIATVREVSARVDQIPVREVFNWGRLYRRVAWSIFLTLGLLAVAAVGYFAWARRLAAADFGYRFRDVAAIWFERNVLLRETLWPRRALLQLLDFPASGELRIGRDAPSPRIRVQALKWVIADEASAEGWRPLRWSDLSRDWLLGPSVPALPIVLLMPPAASATPPPADDPFWTLDRIEGLLEQEETRRRLLAGGITAEEYEALRGVFEVLDQKAAAAAMSRRLRKLEVPADVRIHYWGARSRDEAPMARQQTGVNEFSVVLSDLKESVRFYVEGEDYTTYPYRRITLVPPPMLIRLEKDEFLPAYPYHRPPADGTSADLKGKKQARTGVGVSLTGTASRMEIARGADLILRGEVDKDLDEARLRYRTAGGDGEIGRTQAVALNPDRRTFEIAFRNITQPIEFDFEFIDTDQVRSVRQVIIQPIEDRIPEVNVVVETIRKVGGNYMCTPYAMLPFAGTVRDDHGLSKVEYAASYSRVESMQALALRAAVAAGVMQLVSGSLAPRELLAAPGIVDYLVRMSDSRESATALAPIPMRTFLEIAQEKDREHRYGKADLDGRLAEGTANLEELKRQRQITQFDIKPNLEWLDLQEQVSDFQKGLDATIRPRYRLRITIQATDNNVETGPRTGQNPETFTFLVVPYEELLAEMNKDEENLGYKAQELADKVYELRDAIDKVVERMPREAGSDDFRASASRVEEILIELEKSSDVAREILTDCQRLLKEGQVNRLPQNFIENKERIIGLLDEALRNHFERAREAHGVFRDALQTRQPVAPPIVESSRQRQDELIRQIDQIRDLLATALGITKIAKHLSDVIQNRLDFGALTQMVLQDAKDKIEHSLGELAPTAPAVELKRGERRLVTIDLGRDDFVRGRLAVALDIPQASGLTATSPVFVARLAPSAQVEIAAGEQTGTFEVPVRITNPDGTSIRYKDDQRFVLRVTVR